MPFRGDFCTHPRTHTEMSRWGLEREGYETCSILDIKPSSLFLTMPQTPLPWPTIWGTRICLFSYQG